MASQEGSSFQNPIRFRNANALILYEKGKRAFDNQRPGIYVYDAMGNTFICTKSKSAKGEPIWSRVNIVSLTPVGKYVFINTGKSGTTPITRNASGKEISYTLPSIINKMDNGRVYDKTSFGSFIFVLLSAVEIEKITSPPTGSTLTPPSISSPNSSAYSSFRGITEIYDFMKSDTNGRSGPGKQSSPDTPAKTVYDPAVIAAYKEAYPQMFGDTGSSGSGGSGGKNKGSSANPSPPKGATNSPSTKTVKINFLPDISIYNGSSTYSGYQEKPYIQQTITDFDFVNQNRQRIIRRHIFDIIPNSFEFSQLSSAWNEIERSGNYSMVDWSKYNLTKCTFRFLVASRRTDTIGTSSTIVNDGMDVDIEEELDNIRAIAGAPYPVVFNNLNKFLIKSYRFPYVNNTRGIQWIINDLSINATRLTPNGRKIAAAEVSITLTEYPIIARDIIPLPPLTPDKPIPKQCKPTSKNNFCKPKIINDTVYTGDFGRVPEGDTIATPGAK
jgi:hypothetical protein